MKMKRFFLSLLALSVLLPAAAQVQLNPLFTDHMVLQQRCEVPVWGKAAPGAAVSVKPSWTVKTAKATADADGRWSVTVTTPKGSFKKHTLKIDDGNEPVTIQDVLVGEVWFCSVQHADADGELAGGAHQPG